MSAFGQRKDAVTHVQMAAPLVQGALHTETFLTFFAATNAFCSQTGTHGFGALRPQISSAKDEKPIPREQVRIMNFEKIIISKP